MEDNIEVEIVEGSFFGQAEGDLLESSQNVKMSQRELEKSQNEQESKSHRSKNERKNRHQADDDRGEKRSGSRKKRSSSSRGRMYAIPYMMPPGQMPPPYPYPPPGKKGHAPIPIDPKEYAKMM